MLRVAARTGGPQSDWGTSILWPQEIEFSSKNEGLEAHFPSELLNDSSAWAMSWFKPCHTLSRNPSQISDLQNCELIKACCFKLKKKNLTHNILYDTEFIIRVIWENAGTFWTLRHLQMQMAMQWFLQLWNTSRVTMWLIVQSGTLWEWEGPY